MLAFSGNKHTEKQPLQASHNAPSGSSAKIAVPPLATHRIACSTAVAMTTYRIPKKKPVSKPSQPSKPINMDVSKSHSSIKPKIRPYLPPKDKNESEKNATSVQLAKRTHNFPSKKPESGNPSCSESAKESTSDKKSKGKTDTSPHAHLSSLKNKSDKTKHTSKSLASKPEKSKPELKNKKYVDVDIFAPSSTNATHPELAVAKDSGKKSSSGTTAPCDKSSTSKCSTGKDGKEPVKLAVPPVVLSENKNTSKSKTSVTKSDSKKPTSQATGISTKDSHAQATKEKTVLALDSPAAQQVKKPSPSDLPPVPKPLKEPGMPSTSPSNARVASGTDLPASKKSNLLMTLMGDDINQPAAAKVSLCELKVAKDASTPSSKEAEMPDKAVKKKSKLSLPKCIPPKISPTSESLSKSAAEATETAKDKTIPNSSLLADKAAIDLKIAGKKKQLGTAETSSTASKSTLSQTKTKQLKVKSTSESLSKSTAATSKSDSDKTVPESSVPSDKGAIDLKIAGEKKRKETSENRVPSTASKSKLSRTKSTEQKISLTNGSLSKSADANTESGKDKTVPEKIAIDLKVAGEKKQSAPSITKLPLKAAGGTADKQENVSSNHVRDKHSKKYKKWKRRISDASNRSQPVKKLIISTKDMQIRRDYVVSHSEEKTNRKKSRKKLKDDDDDDDNDDDDYEPSSADEFISACELTSDGSTSSTSYADENSSGYKLSTRGKRRKHSSSSKSSDSETDSSSRKEDLSSRSKRKRQKKELDTSRKKKNSSTKDSDSSSKSSEKRSMDQRSTSLERNPSPLGFDSELELDRLAKKRRLSTKSPGETDKNLAADAKNRRLETRSPLPSTSSNNKYSRIVPPTSGSESSDEDQPVAPVATSSSKTKPKEVSAPEQTLATSEPVSAGPPQIPDSFDLSDDDVFEDDDLHHGKIAGENPRICDVYNCITPGMSFIITSIATDLEVVGKFQERKAKSSPPAREEISEVVIAKEPEDDEVVPFVCVKKPETREVVQLDSSSEDDEPRTIQIESSPSPEPIQQSPPQVINVFSSYDNLSLSL
jgi:hypothetical protein